MFGDLEGVWERCADGSVLQLTREGTPFSPPRVLPVGGVTAIGPSTDGIRALLADGRVADVTTTTARYEAGFAGVTALNGTRAVQVTLVGS